MTANNSSLSPSLPAWRLDHSWVTGFSCGVLLQTGSNVVSVAEHVVMMILTLVRNYMPAHKQIIKGDWNVAEIAKEYVPI